MPDTGAPWNLPYPDPLTGLVRDGGQDIKDLADAVAPLLSGFKVGQVLQQVKLNTFSTTSDTFVNVTGLDQTITPTSTSSKVLIVAHVNLGAAAGAGQSAHVALTGGNAGTYIGAAASNRVRAAGTTGIQDTQFNIIYSIFANTIVYLDSPGVATATTYQVQVRRGAGGTAWINRSGNDADTAGYARTGSSITVIEVLP